MKSPPWVHQLALQELTRKGRILSWICIPICTLWPTRVSLALEEPNSYVFSLMELKSTFVLTSFILWEELQGDQLQGYVCLSTASSWRSWLSRASIFLKMEWSYLVKSWFPYILSKVERFTPLFKGQKRALPSLRRVDPPFIPLPLGKAQRLLVSLNFPKHLPLTLRSLNLLALTLNLNHLSLMWIGWWQWWRVYMNASLDLQISCILIIIIFSTWPPLWHSWMRFNIS